MKSGARASSTSFATWTSSIRSDCRASLDLQSLQQLQIRLDAEPGPLRQREVSVDWLVPVAERAIGQIAIEPLDQRRARQRRSDVRGRDQGRAAIGPMGD